MDRSRNVCFRSRPARPTRWSYALIAATLFATPGFADEVPVPVAPAGTMPATGSLTNATANPAPNAAAGDWPMVARDYANTRFSPLDQVNSSNVAKLRSAWTFSDGVLYGHEAAPLVIGDTMYLVTPYPDVAYALDLSKPGAPIKWAFKPNPSTVAIGKACCDAVNRGAAFANGKLVYNLLDMHTVAVDAATGKELWRTKLGNVEDGQTMTMVPLIVGNKVFVGDSGGEMGVLGWITALDLDTGKELWRAYSVGPDSMVKIGPDFKPFYDSMKGKDLGVSTWPAGMWQHGGGTVWGSISYDPDQNLLIYGTSNPGPRVGAQRPGDNLWTAALFARDADTGNAKWAYQLTPHDEWDYDGINESILIDLPFNGTTRHVLVHFDRNGFAYTIDRTNGEVLVAEPFSAVNWASAIDLKTGLPTRNPDKSPTPEVEVDNICPTHVGSKDWQPGAFSPRTGLVYAAIFNICMDLTNHKVSYIAGTPYDGMQLTTHPGNGGKWGEIIAWDPAKGQKIWGISEQFMTMSGVLATAGDVIFYGTVDGWFRAADARSGKVLWSQKLGSGIISQPIAFLGPDKREYVAVYSGVGGVASQIQAQMPGFPARGSTLTVFSIDGDSPATAPGMVTTAGVAPAATSTDTPD